LIWSDKEAYFFAGRLREGWSGNLLGQGWEYVRGYAGFAGHRTHRRTWLEVTNITRDGMTLTVIPDTTTSPLGVFDGHVHAVHNGALSRWVDGKFVPVSTEEAENFNKGSKGGQFRSVNGWSSEVNLTRQMPGERTYPLRLDGAPVTVLVRQTSGQATVSVQLPSQPPKTILDVHTNSRQFDEPAYRGLFLVALR